jgi:hypothetical protein
MTGYQRLLDEARRFCDPATGEVVELIPEELMRQLRTAKLAVGILGKECQTATNAKWFVFLTDDIRDQALAEWRQAKRKRRRVKKRRVDSGEQDDARPPTKDKVVRGLHGFLRQRKVDK